MGEGPQMLVWISSPSFSIWLGLLKNNNHSWYDMGCKYMLIPKGCYLGMSVKKGLLQQTLPQNVSLVKSGLNPV